MDHSVFFMNRAEDGKCYNYDICCVSMSNKSSIQMVCRPEFGAALVQSLQTISDSTLINTSVTYSINKKRNPVDVNGWSIYELKYSSKFWAHSKDAPVGRMLISRIMFQFGKEHGWSFMVNGNIKGTTDYLWFIRDRNQAEIDRSPVNTDWAYMMPIFNTKVFTALQFVNFPTQIIDPLRTLIQSYWGIESYTNYSLNPEIHFHDFQLRGCPWKSSGSEAVRSRMLLMKCIKFLLGKKILYYLKYSTPSPVKRYLTLG